MFGSTYHWPIFFHLTSPHTSYLHAGEAAAVLALGWGAFGATCGRVTGKDIVTQEGNTTTSSLAGVCMLVKPEPIHMRKNNRLAYLSFRRTYVEAGE